MNLLATSVLFASIVMGVILVWRRLPKASASAVGEAFCLSCGTPARQFSLDAFTCPRCNRDARDLGLAARKPGADQDPFWQLIWFTAILSILALSSTGVLLNNITRVYRDDVQTVGWRDATGYHQLSLFANGITAGDEGTFTGEVQGELLATNGDLLVLEIACPSRRYDIVNSTGRMIVPLSPGPFDEAAILRWMSEAQLDLANAQVRSAAKIAYQIICQTLRVSAVPAPGIEAGIFPLSSTSSYSGFESTPPSLMPACVIAWSIAWLIGTWCILKPKQRPAQPPDAAQGVEA